ncbi:MAG: HEPN domain-containing protein [Thermoleophilaceae bacterium]
MSRPEAERACAFFQRADADLAAIRALEAVDEVPDEIVGFHGQQAAEKLLKAVLAAHGIDFPRTHSIRFLLDLLDDRGLAPPSDLHGVVELYPFGVQLRYEAPLDEEPLDRAAMRALLERLRAWTAAHVS